MSSSSLPLNLGLKCDQFNCGHCDAGGALGMNGLCGVGFVLGYCLEHLLCIRVLIWVFVYSWTVLISHPFIILMYSSLLLFFSNFLITHIIIIISSFFIFSTVFNTKFPLYKTRVPSLF